MFIPPKGRIEWNFNTIIQLFHFGLTLAGGVYMWANLQRDVADVTKWRDSYLLAAAKAGEREEARFKTVEDDVRRVTSQVDTLKFRVDVMDAQQIGMAQAVKETQAAISQQGGDLRVIKEILQRLEAAQKRGG